MANIDPYKVLSVTRKSTPQEIISSFKKLRYKYHPDRPKGNREMYDQVVEAYEKITKNPQDYVRVDDFIRSYKGSDEERKDIIKAYEKYKGNMRKILDSLILVEEDEEEEIRRIIDTEIKEGNLKKYKIFNKKIKKRKNESELAEKAVKEMGIDLSLSLEDILNRQDSRQDDLIKRLEEKYGTVKSLEKKGE